MSNDPYNLSRFIEAQESMYDKALAELQAGKKQGHWMWYIFPQTPKAGMGSMAKYYAINSKEEAQAYLQHPILGSRLIECTQAVLSHDKPLLDIFGTELDVMKFISSMHLFKHVGGEGCLFFRVFGYNLMIMEEKK